MAVKPLYPCEIHRDALTAQPVALELQGAGPAAKSATGSYYPVTRCGAISTAAQYRAHGAGRTWSAGQSRNVAVCGDATGGNAAYGGKHACRKAALWLMEPVRHLSSLQPIRFCGAREDG
jgi:hypothetical protein